MSRIKSPTPWAYYVGLIALLALSIWAFLAQKPFSDAYNSQDPIHFSQQRAMEHIVEIAKAPHYLGSKAHVDVRHYLVAQLKELGLNTQIQTQEAQHSHRYTAATTNNIIATIEGSQPERPALLLMSHYDSGAHASLGASDAGSGVATILEGVRAFLAQGKQPKNTLVILFTDGEEIGLLGANAFVKHHPLAKNIGLVLNFEARGSGGPSYMLMETNQGNQHMVKAFQQANVAHPTANSMMYSIYKMLPNDTDLTVFRENADIKGFNFAFIGDHFDYHTAQDSAERIDIASMNHQADYFTATVNYFSDYDLSQLNADSDDVFFNVPVLGLVSYPFSWSMVLVIIGFIGFIAVAIIHVKRSTQNNPLKRVALSVLALLLSLGITTALGYFGWILLTIVFPQFLEVPSGFTYNGYTLIAFFMLLSCSLTLLIYRFFSSKYSLSIALLLAPAIGLWLLLNLALALYLKGANFFIIPTLFAIAGYAVLVMKRSMNSWVYVLMLTLLAIPNLFILLPQIPSIVIGLGTSILFVSCALTTLLTLLLLPNLMAPKSECVLSKPSLVERALAPQNIMLLSASVLLIIAVAQSNYTAERKKTNSLNYIYNHDTQQAFLISHNRQSDSFIAPVFNNHEQGKDWNNTNYPQSRRAPVRWQAPITPLNHTPATVSVISDENSENSTRTIVLEIQRHSPSNQVYLATNTALAINAVAINGETVLSPKQTPLALTYSSGFFLRYMLAQPESTHEPMTISLQVADDAKLDLRLFEISYDLLERMPQLDRRDETMMPEPFIINDAVIVGQSIDTVSKNTAQ